MSSALRLVEARPQFWKLEGKRPVPIDDSRTTAALEWARWRQDPSKWILAQTRLTNKVFVSTVFLGLDHNFSPDPNAPPILFETMIFGGPLDQEQWRYVTWHQAWLCHLDAVRRAEKAIWQRMRKSRQWQRVRNTGLIFERAE